MSDWNQTVIKVKGFFSAIAAGGNQQQALLSRLTFMDLCRSVARAIIVDEQGETVEKIGTSFSGLAEILNVSMYRISSAAEIPATRLFGRSPAGMNATGESDERVFQTTLKKECKTKLDPQIMWLAQLIAYESEGVLRGQRKPFGWEWGPFVEMSPKEKGEIRKLAAETDQIYINSQVVLPEEVAMSRFRDSGWNQETEVDTELRASTLEVEKKALREGDGGDGKIELAPTDMAKIITVNEARANIGLGKLMLPGGGEDPDGSLTMAEFEAKKKAAAEPAGTAAGEVQAKEIDPEGAKKKEELELAKANNPPAPPGLPPKQGQEPPSKEEEGDPEKPEPNKPGTTPPDENE